MPKATNRAPAKTTKWWHNPSLIFLMLGAIFGITFVTINPPGFGLDERAHFLRAYELSQGHFLTTRTGVDQHIGARIPANIGQWVHDSTINLLSVNTSASLSNRHDADTKLYTKYYHQRLSKETVDDFATNQQLAGTFNYSPLSYLPLAAPVWAGIKLHMNFMSILYLARITNLLLYLLVVYIAIRIAPRFKWLIFIVALLPTAVFQASSVSIDPIINSLSFLLLALFLLIWQQAPKPISLRQAFITLSILGFLAISKQPYALFGLMFLALPRAAFANKKSEIAYKLTWASTPLLLAIIWSVLDRNTIKQLSTEYLQANVSTVQQIKFIIHGPLSFAAVIARTYYEKSGAFLATMIGAIGDRSVGLSNLILVPAAALLMGLGVIHPSSDIAPPRRKRWTAAWLLVVALGVIGAITAALYIGASNVAARVVYGIQGRYFIPVLPFIGVAVSILLRERVRVSRALIENTMIAGSSLLLLGTTIFYYIVNY